MQESFYREGSFEDAHSFYALHDSDFALVRQVSKKKLKEIYKDILSGYMKARGLNVKYVIIGLFRNWP